MSAPHGRSEDARSPRGGRRAAPGAQPMSPSPGRPKMGETPLGGVARSAGVRTMSAPHGRSEGALSLAGTARSARVVQ